mgnify:CR=1 FL=1
MKITNKKTGREMVIKIVINGELIKQVSEFKHLGRNISGYYIK